MAKKEGEGLGEVKGSGSGEGWGEGLAEPEDEVGGDGDGGMDAGPGTVTDDRVCWIDTNELWTEGAVKLLADDDIELRTGDAGGELRVVCVETSDLWSLPKDSRLAGSV